MSNQRQKKACVIAVDGPAGAGKSTVARAVAARLGYVYIDTGAMYRAITLLSIRHNVAPSDVEKLLELLQHAEIRLIPVEGRNRVLLNGEDVTELIRLPEVSQRVSAVAQHARVRQVLVQIQRELAKEGAVVMDGRDIGTVVLPDADVKVFLVADPRVRATRRWEELQQKGYQIPFEQVYDELLARDHFDQTRTESPLRKAPDAIEIDTSQMCIDEVVDTILELCEKADR